MLFLGADAPLHRRQLPFDLLADSFESGPIPPFPLPYGVCIENSRPKAEDALHRLRIESQDDSAPPPTPRCIVVLTLARVRVPCPTLLWIGRYPIGRLSGTARHKRQPSNSWPSASAPTDMVVAFSDPQVSRARSNVHV